MHTAGKNDRFIRFNVAAVLGLVVLTLQARAAEQPKPGPEHKKMAVQVGEWTYEGSSEASPFGPADKFRGKESVQMVLGGFFLEGRDEDKGDSGNIFQAVFLTGYDSLTKTYFSHGFENDGTVATRTTTVTGNTWSGTGTRKDSAGKLYKTRNVDTYSSDGLTSTFAAEYSPDDGKTWLPLWKGTMKKVR